MSPTTPRALIRVWKSYVKSRRHRVAPTTFKEYAKVTNRLVPTRHRNGTTPGMPHWVTSGQDCLEWLTETYSHETARKTLQQLKASTRWAVKNGELRRDPFESIDNLPTRNTNTNKYAAFTPTERSILLDHLAQLPDRQKRWGKFLLMTGARPSELRALQLRHIARDWSILQIHQAYPVDAAQPQGTKNGMVTDWPLNSQQIQLLKAATGGENCPDAWVFKSSNGGPFNYVRFQRVYWGPMVERLAKDEAIAFPLSQYHCRHTWITEALKVMSLKDVEYLARVKAKTLLSVYAQRSRSISTPEI